MTGRGLLDHADVDGLAPYVADADVVALGEREHDAATADIHDSAIEVADLDAVRARGPEHAARAALTRLRDGGVEGVWVHLNVDVLDDAAMPAVDSRQPGGLLPSELTALLATLAADPLTVGFDVTIYDPELELGGDGAELVVALLADGIARRDD